MIIGYVNRAGKELLGEIELAGELSFDYFELTVESPNSTSSIIRESKRQIIEHIQSYNLGIVGHMPWYLHVAFPYESVQRACIAEFEDAIDAAGEVGAKKITIHTEFLPKFHKTREELVQQTIQNIAGLSDYCRSRGQNLLIENYMDFSMNANELEQLIKTCRVGMTYDVGHEFANSKGDTQKVIAFARRFSKNIVHMHFSDNDGKADSHMAISKGKMDWKKLIPALKSIYDGPITLEIADTAGALKSQAINAMKITSARAKKNKGKKMHAIKIPEPEKTSANASDLEKAYRESVFDSKVFVEKGWYGRKKARDDYEYIYPKGKKPVLKI